MTFTPLSKSIIITLWNQILIITHPKGDTNLNSNLTSLTTLQYRIPTLCVFLYDKCLRISSLHPLYLLQIINFVHPFLDEPILISIATWRRLRRLGAQLNRNDRIMLISGAFFGYRDCFVEQIELWRKNGTFLCVIFLFRDFFLSLFLLTFESWSVRFLCNYRDDLNTKNIHGVHGCYYYAYMGVSFV